MQIERLTERKIRYCCCRYALNCTNRRRDSISLSCGTHACSQVAQSGSAVVLCTDVPARRFVYFGLLSGHSRHAQTSCVSPPILLRVYGGVLERKDGLTDGRTDGVLMMKILISAGAHYADDIRRVNRRKRLCTAWYVLRWVQDAAPLQDVRIVCCSFTHFVCAVLVDVWALYIATNCTCSIAEYAAT